MKTHLLRTLAIAAALSAIRANALDLPITPGKFVGTMDSMTNYSCPEWFRDAKFGIWAHWGPQAVPMEGDWYARKMYQQGTPDYNDHLARWGHPSTNGWKDIIPLWKAEKWDPEKLIELYKKAGAKYFVSMGSHHDDFFLWNSPLHTGTPSTMARTATWWPTGRRPRRKTACISACPNISARASVGFKMRTSRTRPARWRACLTTGPIQTTGTCIISPPRRTTRAGIKEPALAAAVV